MNGNKQTGLTHLHVYNFVIYRMERGTVACILITACRSLRKIHGNSSHAFHELYGGIKDGRLHENLTIQSQPSESHPRNREKEGATHRLYGSWTARLLSQLHGDRSPSAKAIQTAGRRVPLHRYQVRHRIILVPDQRRRQSLLPDYAPLLTLHREHQRVRKYHPKALFRSRTLHSARKESIQIREIYRRKKRPDYMDK